MGVDLAALRDLILVVDAGSLTRAAVAARVSQPAMSQRMAQLEAVVGVRLLERGPRGIEPTAAGIELYRRAQQVVRQVDGLTDDLGAGTRAIRGTVSLGLPATVAPVLAPGLVTLVRDRHPGIRLRLFESMSGYVEELLGRGRLDLAVLFGRPGRAGADELELYTEEVFLATAATAAGEGGPVSAAELARRPLVAPGGRSNLRDLLDAFCAAARVEPDVVAEVESLAAMVRIAQSGEASALLPRSVASTFAGPSLSFRPLDPAVHRTVAVRLAPEHHEPRAAVVAVRDAVADAVQHTTDRGGWPGAEPVHR